jgi:hypothetical protein
MKDSNERSLTVKTRTIFRVTFTEHSDADRKTHENMQYKLMVDAQNKNGTRVASSAMEYAI